MARIITTFEETFTMMVNGEPKTIKVEHSEATMSDITAYYAKVKEMERIYDALKMEGAEVYYECNGDMMEGQSAELTIVDGNGMTNRRCAEFHAE